MRQEGATRLRQIDWTLWPLAVYWTSANGFTVTVRASFLILLGMLAGVALFLQGLVPLLQGEPLPSSIDWPSLIGFIALALLGTAIHEAGHVAGYRAAGLRWTEVTLKCGASVRAEGQASDRQQVAISALGPAMQTLFGVALMALSPIGTTVWLGGILSVFDGTANLLLPVSSNMDSTTIYRNLGRILTHPRQPKVERVH